MLTRMIFVALAAAPAVAQSTVFDGSAGEGDINVLEGAVVTADGAAISGASIVLRERVPGESDVRGRASTGASGRFSLRVESRTRDGYMRNSYLEVEAPGLASTLVENIYLPSPNYDVGRIVLVPPVELHGRVTSADGRPIEGAQIHAALGTALAPYGDHAHRVPIAVTDADGKYTCRVLPPGLVTIGAGAVGFADKVQPAASLDASDPNQLNLILDLERTVRVRVTAKDHSPLEGATVAPLGDVWGDEPYVKQDRYMAFWRGPELTDVNGEITWRGLDASFSGSVLVTHRRHRSELVELKGEKVAVSLQPVTWIDVVASREVGPDPQIYFVNVRDKTRSSSWCGNCEDTRWARLWRDSPAVEVVAGNHWRIAWNGPGCYVDGGQPSLVNAELTDGVYAHAELGDSVTPGERLHCDFDFEQSARLSGVVRDPDGHPVSLRLGVQLSMSRPDWLSAVSDADGRFEFDQIRGGPQWLYSLDAHWNLESHKIELEAGHATNGVEITVQPQPQGRTGKARGIVRIDGKVPSEPVLLALDEVPNQHLPDAYPRGFAWTDREGRFEIDAPWPREYHIVPKHQPKAPFGGWRDFGNEFPSHDERWPWIVIVPASGTTETAIDFPAESEWDAVAPPKED